MKGAIRPSTRSPGEQAKPEETAACRLERKNAWLIRKALESLSDHSKNLEIHHLS